MRTAAGGHSSEPAAGRGSRDRQVRRDFVKHVIKRHPDAETTATARCVHPDCGWEAPPTGDANECADWCMEHTGRTGHGIFLRTFSTTEQPAAYVQPRTVVGRWEMRSA
ncbi:DUF7848 domain-containing protein [Streptomyces avidinii]|uniref:DUF7848 domain-containing protein n=1 Tax=Streptomyces avidinii TaxID=1895 RepID=UPI003FD6C074